MIPKIAHFYWGEKTLPYMRYLTLKSFCRYNPDWEVRLYIPMNRSEVVTWKTHEHKYTLSVKDYFVHVRDLPVQIIKTGFDHIGPSRILPEVHRSDFLRWYILAHTGGLWSDMDILYTRPIPFPYQELQTWFCSNLNYQHSIGFLASSPDNPVYHLACKTALRIYNPSNYQGAGCIVMNQIDGEIRKLDPAAMNLPMDIVYPYDALHIRDMFSADVEQRHKTPRNIGIHWYAGHGLAGQFQGGEIKKCILLDVLKQEGYDAEFYNSFGYC